LHLARKKIRFMIINEILLITAYNTQKPKGKYLVKHPLYKSKSDN
jgi:hypothetical protein